LTGCDKTVVDRDKVFVKIPFDSYTLELSTKSTFYIPIDIELPNPYDTIVLRESPVDSEVVFIEGQTFLKWSPKNTGQYKIRISNKADNFTQVYILIVK
jgi:hypothetical protein